MPTFFQVKTFVSYWLDAVNKHSLHSPFFFDLYTNVIQGQSTVSDFNHIENLRRELLKNTRIIPRSNFGAGSAAIQSNSVTISDIARTSLTPQKYLLLYNRIINHFHFTNIIELGTSLGISSLYLSHSPNTTLTTFEGSPEIAETARLTFEFGNASNIKLIEGNIDSTLANHLGAGKRIDLAFIDANHRYEPTIKYFNLLQGRTHNKSIIVLDDIHYSAEMERAWNEIKRNKLVYATADLYRCGLVFFDPSLTKQHVVLQF